MATDIASLSIKVENGDVVKATTSLNTMAVAGGKTEASTQRLTRRIALLEIEARNMDAAMQRGGAAMNALEVEARKMDAELNQSARAMALVEIEARKMDVELERSQRAMHLVELEARKMDAAMAAARSSTIYNTRAMALQHEQALKMNAAMGSSQTTIAGLTGLVTRLAAAFAAYKVAQFANETVLLAARFETLGVAMDAVGRNAGISAGRMAALQAELQHTGISAIESRQNLTRLVQAHIQLSDASKLARIAQDAAVIGNINSSESFATLVHGIQSAQTDVLRTIGINVNFEESYRRLAAQLGTTSDALTETQKTQARVNAVMDAGSRIAGTYEAAMGTVGKQLASTTRYLEDMRVKVGTAFLPEYAATVKGYADALKLIADNAPAVIGAVTGITTAIGALLLLVKGSAIVSGIAAIGTAIAAIGASPIIVATAALAALGVVVGSFAADAALARREAAEFSETLKHLPDAALVRNIDRTALAVAELNAEIAQGGAPTKYQSDRLAELTEKLKQYSAARAANAAAKTSGDANAAAAAAEAARAEAAKRADEAAKEAKKNLEELQKATDAYYNTLNQRQIDAIKAAGTMRDQNAAMREMIEATKEGPAAIEALTIAQAGDNAVRALGIGVSEKAADAVRREAEERERLAIALGHVKDAQADDAQKAQRAADEADREIERQAKELHRTVSRTIEGILTDIDNKKNPFVAIFDNLKRGAIHAISEILATKVEGKVAEFLGIEMPASKQEKAGKDMKEAADKQLRAAELMNGGPSNVAGITVDGGQPSPAMAQYLQKFLKVGGAAVGGFELGSAIGQTTGNKTTGALGGAVSGAALGFQVAGPLGAAAGGIAGFIGGILGAGDAARAAAERLRKAKEAFDSAFESAKAEVAGDQLAIQIAQVHAQYNGLRDALKEATPWLQEFIGKTLGLGTYAEKLAEVNRLEQERIQQLTEEAEAMRRYFSQSLDVRILRAQGKTKEADTLEFRNRQEQERDEFRRTHDLTDDKTTADDGEVARNFADYNKLIYAQSLELQANTKALTELTTSVRGGPSGFKLNGYIQQYATGLPHPAMPQSPLPWPTLPAPMSPLAPPKFYEGASSTGKVAMPSITIAPGAIVVNESKTPQLTADAIMKAVLSKVDQFAASDGGLNGSRGRAFEKMPS